MRRVIVESPYAGRPSRWVPSLLRSLAAWWLRRRNLRYLRAALADCLRRDEAPFASHALYTQRGVLRDGDPTERQLGILAGLNWAACADAVVVYEDHGVTPGMEQAIAAAMGRGTPVEFRRLP